MRAKFGVLEQNKGLHVQAKFHLNVFIVSASGGHNFGQILTFWGLLYRPPLLPMRAKFGVLQQTQGLHLQTKLHLNVFIVSASRGQKPQFLANFDIFWGSCIDAVLPMRAQLGVL